MPSSIDPQPRDDEIECARCGAYFYYELTRCPACGVSVYDPEEDDVHDIGSSLRGPDRLGGLLSKIGYFFRKILGKPYLMDEVFGSALDYSELYDDLLIKVGGDHSIVKRLIELERQKWPDGTRIDWLRNAIQRWERDNRISGTKKI
jgi:hypothetical protein